MQTNVKKDKNFALLYPPKQPTTHYAETRSYPQSPHDHIPGHHESVATSNS